MRVYEMVTDPAAREMVGYFLVRGGLHVVAYARALELLTGVAVTKLVPVPELSNKAFPETRKYEENSLHRKLYTYSTDDYQQAGLIWNGEHPEDGQPLEVVFGAPEGFTPPELEEEPQLNAPVPMISAHKCSKILLLKWASNIKENSNRNEPDDNSGSFFMR